MKQTLRIGLFVAALAGASAGATPDRPNIILIVTDDQGWWDLGCHGNPVIQTPAMDRLASEGVEFTRFYASPVCTPTRASLMTGRYYQRTGAVDTYRGLDVMDHRETTLPQLLRQSGYRTGLVGKWHLGRYMRYHPNNRGFDHFFGFWQYGFINRYDDSDELFLGRVPVVTTGYVTDVLTDEAIAFIQRSRGPDAPPFFLEVTYNAPHSPYLVPDKYIEPYLAKGVPLGQARIYGMVTCIDDNITRILDVLAKSGLDERTIVLFMSDNGGVSSYYKAGLRGQKGSVYEGGVRVPLFIRWPGQFKPGTKISAIGAHMDLLPTLCEIAGAPVPKDLKLDGVSLLPRIRDGAPSPHKYLFHQWNRSGPRPYQSWAAQGQRYKLANGELFDLDNDPGEKTDIAGTHPELVREMKDAYDAWYKDVTAGRTYDRVPIEIGRDDENPVEIDIAWSDPIGEPAYKYRHYNRDSIEGMRQAGDGIRWKVDVVQPGRYEVTLVYGCDPGEEGSSFELALGTARLEASVASTGGRMLYQSRAVGTIELPSGPGWLELKAARVGGRELMVLHKVWLRKLP